MNIKLVNIRFRLDGDARDKQIHDALFAHPNGARNQVIKAALYNYLIGENDEDRKDTRARKSPFRVEIQSKDIQSQEKGSSDNSVDQSSTSKRTASDNTNESSSNPTPNVIEEDIQMIAGLRSMIL